MAFADVVEALRRTEEYYAGSTLYSIPTASLHDPLYLELTVSQCYSRKPIFYIVLKEMKTEASKCIEMKRGDVHMTFLSSYSSDFLRSRVPSQYCKKPQEWSDLGTKVGNLFDGKMDWTLSFIPLPSGVPGTASNLGDWLSPISLTTDCNHAKGHDFMERQWIAKQQQWNVVS